MPWTNVTRPPEDKFYIQQQLLANKGPPIPEYLKTQNQAYEFIELCLQPNRAERPSAKELLDHPYPRVRIGKISFSIRTSILSCLFIDS